MGRVKNWALIFLFPLPPLFFSVHIWFSPTLFLALSLSFSPSFTFTDTVVLDGFFRLGVSDLGEIRLLTNYNSPGVTLSAKIKLIRPKDYRPGIGISASVADFRVTDYRLMIDQKISDNIGGVVNVGYGSKFYTIVYGGFTLGDKFSTYLEAYFESQYTQLNTGLVFLLNHETQLDLNLGLYNFDSGYVGVGIARRFMFKD